MSIRYDDFDKYQRFDQIGEQIKKQDYCPALGLLENAPLEPRDILGASGPAGGVKKKNPTESNLYSFLILAVKASIKLV